MKTIITAILMAGSYAHATTDLTTTANSAQDTLRDSYHSVVNGAKDAANSQAAQDAKRYILESWDQVKIASANAAENIRVSSDKAATCAALQRLGGTGVMTSDLLTREDKVEIRRIYRARCN